MSQMVRLRAAVLFGAVIYGQAALAALVTWFAEAKLPESYNFVDAPLGSLAPNDPVRISFQIDTNAVSIGTSPDMGFYEPLSFDLHVGPYHMDSSNADANLAVWAPDNFVFAIHPRAGVPSPDLQILQVAFAFFGLVPPAADVRVPTVVPSTLEVAFDMDVITPQSQPFVLSFTDRQFRAEVRSHQVPVPAFGTFLLGSMLALIGAVRDRQRGDPGQASSSVVLHRNLTR